VAAAQGHQARNISSKDPGERLDLYKELGAKLFDEQLAAIFERALASFSASPPEEADL